MDNEFSLIPFKASGSDIEGVNGTIYLRDGYLIITYRVSGNIEEMSMPQPLTVPTRRNGLWKESCFECFVQNVGCEDYHEVNLSPNGDWNVYRFTGYRAGMVEEFAIDNIDSTTRVEPDKVTICCRIPLNGFLSMASPIQVGISSVLLCRSATLSYWSLVHPKPHPDFHDSRGFRLQLGCS